MNNNFGLSNKDLSQIIDLISNQSEVECAIIFGSRAKGNYKRGSDVDIALKGELVSSKVVNKISYLLNEETMMPYKFDILNYNSLTNIDLMAHIDRVGIKIYHK